MNRPRGSAAGLLFWAADRARWKAINLKDVDGKPFIRDMLEIKDAGWVNYKW